MGLSNAERQKRHREKLKAARDVGRGAFVRALIARNEAQRADPEWKFEADLPATVAGQVGAILSALGILSVRDAADMLPEDVDVIDALGGVDYVASVLAWRSARRDARGARRTNIPPPPLPVQPTEPVT